MRDSQLMAAISNALDAPTWDSSIRDTKSVVRNAIRAMDRGVVISDTSYFNHTFVPDFVLDWPNDPRQSSRDLFLRLDSSPFNIKDDLQHLREGRPILLGLEPLREEESPEGELTSSLADTKTADAMVIDPMAVAGFANSEKTSFGSVLPSAVLKGGKGVVDDLAGEALRASTRRVFEAAASHEAQPIAAGVEDIQPYLQEDTSRRLLNLARIVWESTGGEPTEFPATTDLDSLDIDSLTFLLTDGPPDDILFWRNVGRTITLDNLFRAGVVDAPNWRIFLASNLDRISARAVRLKERKQTSTRPGWSLNRQTLQFSGPDFDGYVASYKSDLPGPDEVYPPTITDFQSRTRNHQIVSMTVSTARATDITIDSIVTNVSTDESVALLARDPTARVDSASIKGSRKRMEVNFRQRTAGGHTGAKFTLEEIILRAIPVLWRLDSRSRDEFASLLEINSIARLDDPRELSAVSVDADRVPELE